MTPEQLSTLTLVELEALAARMEAAARTIRDAMALLHGAPQAGLAQGTAPPPQPAFVLGYNQLEAQVRAPGPAGNGRKVVPPIDRNDPERAALLAQFAKDGEPVEAVPVRRVEVDAFGGGT